MNEGKLIDLDEYRKRRTDEGTWPPSELDDVLGYWRSHRNKKKPTYDVIDPKDKPPEPPPEPDRACRRKDDSPSSLVKAMWGALVRPCRDLVKPPESSLPPHSVV